MIIKQKDRDRAIILRKKGFSYSEILKIVPVAKSTLSLWLRSVGLAKHIKIRLTEKRRLGQLKGAASRKSDRIERSEAIFSKAEKDVKSISERELWLIGTALYWAEGSKEKSSHPGIGVIFNNSDPNMILVFLRWLTDICKVNITDIKFELYIHKYREDKLEKVKKYWANILNVSVNKLDKVYYKREKINTKRTNVGDLYNGLLRVKVRSSSSLNRQIAGWTRGIIKNLPGGEAVSRLPLKQES